MHRLSFPGRLLALLFLNYIIAICLASPDDGVKKAIIPTEAGQIGVWPPDYSVPPAANTNDFSYGTSGSKTTTKWIGHDTAWMTQGPTTTVVSGSTKTATATAYSMKVSTVKDVGTMTGITAGDLYVELPPPARDILLEHAKTACGASKKKRWFEKRQSGGFACPRLSGPGGRSAVLQTFGNDVAADNRLVGDFGQIPAIQDASIREIVAALTGAGVTAATKNKVAIAGLLFGILLTVGEMPQQAKVEKGDLDAGATYPPSAKPGTPTTTSSDCTSTATGSNKPRCADKTNCNGDKNEICQSGKHRGCKCAGDTNPALHFGKDIKDRYNEAEAVLQQIDDTVKKAAAHPWCVHECSQSSNPRCVCRCGDDTYSEAAKITPVMTDKNSPTPSPTESVGYFFAGPCPYISGDPVMSKIAVTQRPSDITHTAGPSSFPNYKPAASSQAAVALRAFDNQQNFVRDTATKAAKARCKQLASEVKKDKDQKKTKPSDAWPGTCVVPNTGAKYNEPQPRNRPSFGGCVSDEDETDIAFSMAINRGNDLCSRAGYDKLTFDRDECEKAFQSIIDGLPDFRDLKRKHGGEYYSPGCWTYGITPKYHCRDLKACPEVKEQDCDQGWGAICMPAPALPPMKG